MGSERQWRARDAKYDGHGPCGYGDPGANTYTRGVTNQPEAESSRVRASDGVAIAVHEMGGAGPPLVLAHGTGLHARVWEPLVASLGEPFRAVAFDARGHGDSGVSSPPEFNWDGFALDVLAVVDGLGLRRPHGLGHSSGATALLMAEETRPGTFATIYCFEPVIVAADPPLGRDAGSWLAMAARRRREVFASRAEAYHAYAAKPPFSGVDPEALRAYVEHGFHDLVDGTVRLKCRAENEALVDEMATAHRCYGLLGKVACPVTLACGDADDGTSALALRDPASRLRRGRLEELAGLGHLGPLQDPTAVARSFQDHVARQPASSRKP